jgi:hypothetical protein
MIPDSADAVAPARGSMRRAWPIPSQMASAIGGRLIATIRSRLETDTAGSCGQVHQLDDLAVAQRAARSAVSLDGDVTASLRMQLHQPGSRSDCCPRPSPSRARRLAMTHRHRQRRPDGSGAKGDRTRSAGATSGGGRHLWARAAEGASELVAAGVARYRCSATPSSTSTTGSLRRRRRPQRRSHHQQDQDFDRGVTDLPEPVSATYRNRVPTLSPRNRNPCVHHEPDSHKHPRAHPVHTKPKSGRPRTRCEPKRASQRGGAEGV